jgi:hypothetical protein
VTALDVDCTDNCPIAAAVETCGAITAPACGAPDDCGAAAGRVCELGCPCLTADLGPDRPVAVLAVPAIATLGKVIYLTRCGSCAEAGELPRTPSSPAAVRRVHDHCERIGRAAEGRSSA